MKVLSTVFVLMAVAACGTDDSKSDIPDSQDDQVETGTVPSDGGTQDTSPGGTLPLTFVPDPGIRVDKATNAWASVAVQSDGSQKVYLWYSDRWENAQGPAEEYVIISDDGLTFDRATAIAYKRPNFPDATEDVIRNDPRHKLMPNEENGGPVWRRFSGTPDGVKTHTSTDGINFAIDEGFAYLYHNEGEGFEHDQGLIGYNDVHPTPDGRLVFAYIGDMQPQGYNNVRIAVSTDNGKSFQWEAANVLDDAKLVEDGGHQACAYVDPKPTVLPDQRIWFFLMTQACEPPAPVLGRSRGYIHSFQSDDGITFTHDEGIRLQPSDFDWDTYGFVVYSLNDPTVVLLGDGRFRMFVTARICESQNPKECDTDGSGNIREVLVSATATP